VTIFFLILSLKKKVITDHNGFFGNLPVFDHFDDKFGGEDKTIESQSSGGLFKDMKNLLASCFGVPRSINGFVVATIVQKHDYTAKLGTA
jgi:hypothetical protein